MTRRKLRAPVLLLGVAAVVVASVAYSPGLKRARAQSTDEYEARARKPNPPDPDATALQGSWQGHPTATTCTGVFAPTPAPAPGACTYSFYTMTTFIPTGIAYGSPMIPGASPGHGRWTHVSYLNFMLRGQIFVNGPQGVPIARGITQETITVD